MINPATSEELGKVPLGTKDDADAAVRAAAAAFPGWRRTPREDRVQYLFKLQHLLEEHLEELARVCTQENGKTLSESRRELRQSIGNVEVARRIPTVEQEYNLEDLAAGTDETTIGQPLGVMVAITPFNFPSMIPFWFLPYAIACGNTFILKPSEKVPLTAQRTFELMEELKLPAGVLNLVHGGKPVVDALLEHPGVQGIDFVGSSPVAKSFVRVRRCTASECNARGERNHVLILPDADMESCTRIVSESAFGCAGQRCLAVSSGYCGRGSKDLYRGNRGGGQQDSCGERARR